MEGRHDRDEPLEEEPKGGLLLDDPEDIPIVILPDDVDLASLRQAIELPAKPHAAPPLPPPPHRPAPQRPPPSPPARRLEPAREKAPVRPGLPATPLTKAVGPKPVLAVVPARVPAKVAARPKSRLRAATRWIVAAGVLIASVAGFLVIRQGFVAKYFPMPGPLSAAHARVEAFARTPDCRRCHRDEGLAVGCLGCHEEIAGQFAEGRGLHHFLLKGGGAERDCVRCHLEHQGRQYELAGVLAWKDLDRERFQHPHLVDFLRGRHSTLPCKECHEKKVARRFSLSAFPALEREKSFLGLAQTCVSCHADPHAHGLSGKCDSCHGQESFRGPGPFDHSGHLALAGGHAGVPCGRCHAIPEGDRVPLNPPEGFPFAEARGKSCVDCHKSPHRTSFSQDCSVCHAVQEPSWSSGAKGMTLALHEETGFSLRLPHADLACGKCHDPALPYAGRYPDPAKSAEPRAQDRCRSCHRDVHGGQFLASGKDCLDCHAREAFQPSRFDREAHARVFPLVDAHQAVECRSCHKEDPKTGVRAFTGLPRDCEGCHADPHRGQFAREGQACSGCHETRRFMPALFGQGRHEAVFALQGLHRAVACDSCHRPEEGTRMRVFKGSPRECKGCHADPHGVQFGKELLASDCTACHSPRSDTFSIPGFDHSGRTRYALVGSHAKAGCRQCHREETLPAAAQGAAAIRVFRGTPQTCGSCHLDIHRGQFRRVGAAPCEDCHASPESWKLLKFDHNLQGRFALDGSHARVPCGKCHPQVRLKDESLLTQYRPLGTQCRDCHEVTAH